MWKLYWNIEFYFWQASSSSLLYLIIPVSILICAVLGLFTFYCKYFNRHRPHSSISGLPFLNWKRTANGKYSDTLVCLCQEVVIHKITSFIHMKLIFNIFTNHFCIRLRTNDRPTKQQHWQYVANYNAISKQQNRYFLKYGR